MAEQKYDLLVKGLVQFLYLIKTSRAAISYPPENGAGLGNHVAPKM